MNHEEKILYCTKCGNKGIPIRRLDNRNKEEGHLKKLWCIYCKEEVNHAEISHKYTYSDFLFEYTHNNFDNGQRILPFKTLKQQYKEEK